MRIANVFVVFFVLWQNCLAHTTACLSPSTKAAPAGLQKRRVYSFINVATGLALDVFYENESNGAIVGTFTPLGKNSQKWRAMKSDAGWKLKSLIGNNKCLTQEKRKKPKLQQWSCWNSYDQQWHARELWPGATIYNIVCLSSGHVITAHGISAEPVTMEVEQRANSRQQWVIKCY